LLFFVFFMSLKIGGAQAICAAGQRSTMVPISADCTEPVLIGRGQYHNFRCDMYKNYRIAQSCPGDANCDRCPCSCVPANTGCPQRLPFSSGHTEVCTTCLGGERGDGLTCTVCAPGTFSTNPVSDVCWVGMGNNCPVTRTVICTGRCGCNSHTVTHHDAIVLSDGPGPYINGLTCKFILTSNFNVTLQFEQFVTTIPDVVRIFRCTTVHCGSNSIELLFATGDTDLSAVYATDTTHPFLVMTFKADDTDVAEGWVANWKVGSSAPRCAGITCMPGQYMQSNSHLQLPDTCSSCPIGKYK